MSRLLEAEATVLSPSTWMGVCNSTPAHSKCPSNRCSACIAIRDIICMRRNITANPAKTAALTFSSSLLWAELQRTRNKNDSFIATPSPLHSWSAAAVSRVGAVAWFMVNHGDNSKLRVFGHVGSEAKVAEHDIALPAQPSKATRSALMGHSI